MVVAGASPVVSLAAYIPATLFLLAAGLEFAAILLGFYPSCYCTGVCSCPGEVGPPPLFVILGLLVLGSVAWAAAFYLRRRAPVLPGTL